MNAVNFQKIMGVYSIFAIFGGKMSVEICRCCNVFRKMTNYTTFFVRNVVKTMKNQKSYNILKSKQSFKLSDISLSYLIFAK